MVKVALGTWGLQRWFDGDFASVVDLMHRADERNVDQVSITDHVVMGDDAAVGVERPPGAQPDQVAPASGVDQQDPLPCRQLGVGAGAVLGHDRARWGRGARITGRAGRRRPPRS